MASLRLVDLSSPLKPRFLSKVKTENKVRPRPPSLDMIRGIRFKNIHCRAESGVYVAFPISERVSDITFDDVSVKISRSQELLGCGSLLRPSSLCGRAQVGRDANLWFQS